METLDIFFNGSCVGSIEYKDGATREDLIKKAEIHFPRRTVTIKKILFMPSKCISFIEKKHE